MALTIWLGIWVTPPDKVQGNLARLLYVHPAIAMGGAVPVLRHGDDRERAVPVATTRSVVMDRVAHCADGGEPRLHRPHAHHRVDLGTSGLGRLVGLGRAAHLDGDPRRAGARLPGAASRPTTTPSCARDAARSSRSSRRSTCRSSTSRCSGGTRCTRARRCSDRTASSRSTARCSGRCCSASSPSHCALRVAAARALPTRGEARTREHRDARGRAGAPSRGGGPLVDYVTAGYSFAFGGLALYALSIWWRGRRLD